MGQMHTVTKEITVQLIAVVAMNPERTAMIDLIDPEIQAFQVFPALIRNISYGDQTSDFRINISSIALFISQFFHQFY
ncbi:MAG: hypothetical protein IJY52_03725, partial [Anaerotignum sp.]|nr:hypothetical protein [Anaerotignum sp.]